MRNLRRMRVLVAGLALFASMALLAMPASADLVFGLNTEFSGGTPPAGSTPWVTATFTDIAGGVQLTIAALNLVAREFISEFAFNFNPAKNAATYLPTPTGTGTQTEWNSIGAGNDAFKADGDGFFDFIIDFPPPPGTFSNEFTAGETFVVNILGAGLTTADFNFASVNGPIGKTGFSAALIQKRDDARDYLDTAWTIELIRGTCLCVILWIAAPGYSDEAEALPPDDASATFRGESPAVKTSNSSMQGSLPAPA